MDGKQNITKLSRVKNGTKVPTEVRKKVTDGIIFRMGNIKKANERKMKQKSTSMVECKTSKANYKTKKG